MQNLSSVGSLLSRAWAIYAERMQKLLLLVVIGWAVGIGAMLLAVPSIFGTLSSVDKGGITQPAIFGISAGWAILLMIVAGILWTWIKVAMAYAVSEEGRGLTLGELFDRSRKKIVPSIVVGILTGLILIAGFILLVIPGVIFTIWFWASFFVVLFEDKEGLEALRQSKRHMTGRIGPVVLRLLFVWLCMVVVSMVANGIEAVLGVKNAAILGAVVPALFTPLWVAYTYLLYREIAAPRATESAPAAGPVSDPIAPVSHI